MNNIQHSFFAPYLLLWFLASHICWRLLMLGMSRWTRSAQLAFAVTAGVAVGYLQLDGIWFSISRTFVYLPFFCDWVPFLLRGFREAISAVCQKHCRRRFAPAARCYRSAWR
ncbi:hypothetical protein ACFTAO_09895 [Paenibacillus rhizoplanae]